MNTIIKIISFLRRCYWAVIRPTTVGVRAIIVNADREILLVKHRYAKNWFLPGGGVKKGESFTKAIHRELSEEVGIERYDKMVLLGCYSNFFESKSDYIAVFVIHPATLSGDPKSVEIAEYAFFPLSALPEGLSPGTRKRIQEYLGEKTIDFNW